MPFFTTYHISVGTVEKQILALNNGPDQSIYDFRRGVSIHDIPVPSELWGFKDVVCGRCPWMALPVFKVPSMHLGINSEIYIGMDTRVSRSMWMHYDDAHIWKMMPPPVCYHSLQEADGDLVYNQPGTGMYTLKSVWVFLKLTNVATRSY
jgi:hypothetical protein